MADINKCIKRLGDVKRCFVRFKGEYRLHDVKLNLPSIPIKYEEVLKKMNIEYVQVLVERGRRQELFCKYWDRNVFQERDEELPCYEFQNKMYWYVGNVTEKVPTKKSIIAALELKQKVDAEIAEVRKNKCINAIKDLMGETHNAVYTKKGLFKGATDEGVTGNYYIFVNKYPDGTETSDVIIFDLDKIYNQEVVLEVPGNKLARIVGENNCHAQMWVDTLGLDRLEIRAV